MADDTPRRRIPIFLILSLGVGGLLLFSVLFVLAYGATARPAGFDPATHTDYASKLREHAHARLDDPLEAEAFYETVVRRMLDAVSSEDGALLGADPSMLYMVPDIVTSDHDSYDQAGMRDAPYFNEELYRETERLLAETGTPELLALYDRMVDHPGSLRPIDDTTEPLMFTLLPELGPARSLARVLAARAHLARKADDVPGMTVELERILALGRHLANNPTTLERLVAEAVTELALARLEVFLSHDTPSAEDLAGIAAALERQRGRPPIKYALTAERVSVEDFLQFIYTKDGVLVYSAFEDLGGNRVPLDLDDTRATLALRLASQVEPMPWLANAACFFEPRLDQTRRVIDDAWAELDVAVRGEDFDPGVFDAITDSIVTSDAYLPTYTVRAVVQADLRYNAARLRVAIERYRLDHGEPPPTLDDLVPGYLPEVPEAVAFDADRRFNYCNGPTEYADYPYVLSVDGPDKTPDGGRHNPCEDDWQDVPAGDDIVFNAPSCE
ncbi:MAG: hypothetical protein AAF108_10955 [Planctomycetota bacterium]